MTDGGSSIREVQLLLAALVASKPRGRFAEVGTAFGLGARAIAQAMGRDSTFVTVELDRVRYEQSVAALADTRAEVLNARWQDVLPERAPFDLVFFDGGSRDDRALELAISLLGRGGFLVKDDMTPGRPVDGDPVRELLLRDDRLAATEIMTTERSAAIIAVRL